jgi:hypothetical protein
MRNIHYRLWAIVLVCAAFIFGGQKITLAATQNNIPISHPQIALLNVPQNVNEYFLQYQPETYKTLSDTLAAGIEDAKQPELNEVVNNLLVLSPDNPKIKWRNNNGKIEYLMSTWKYTANPTGDWPVGTTKLIKYQTWFTAVPEVKEFCQQFQLADAQVPDNIELSLRLQQYLGLILNKYANKTHFVEMWVKGEDLIRPCIDPEINDSSCNVFPVPVPDSSSLVKAIYTNSYSNASLEYYPWTGLGYTYDWGNPQTPHAGASEFIINPTPETPVEVEIASVTPTQEYCQSQVLQ